MRGKTMVAGGLAVLAAWQFGGCNVASLIPIPPIDLDLAGAGVGAFQLQAGTPELKVGQFSSVSLPAAVSIGGGSLQIDPDAISITRSDNTGNKQTVAAQSIEDVQTCLDACSLAIETCGDACQGLSPQTCSDVCENSQLDVRVWIGTVEKITESCENGDEYVFNVTLDDDGRPLSVSATPDQLQPKTRTVLGSSIPFGLCVQVLAPFDATILVNTVTLNIRLQ